LGTGRNLFAELIELTSFQAAGWAYDNVRTATITTLGIASNNVLRIPYCCRADNCDSLTRKSLAQCFDVEFFSALA
jgi:hypothetical protein